MHYCRRDWELRAVWLAGLKVQFLMFVIWWLLLLFQLVDMINRRYIIYTRDWIQKKNEESSRKTITMGLIKELSNVSFSHYLSCGHVTMHLYLTRFSCIVSLYCLTLSASTHLQTPSNKSTQTGWTMLRPSYGGDYAWNRWWILGPSVIRDYLIFLFVCW